MSTPARVTRIIRHHYWVEQTPRFPGFPGLSYQLSSAQGFQPMFLPDSFNVQLP